MAMMHLRPYPPSQCQLQEFAGEKVTSPAKSALPWGGIASAASRNPTLRITVWVRLRVRLTHNQKVKTNWLLDPQYGCFHSV